MRIVEKTTTLRRRAFLKGAVLSTAAVAAVPAVARAAAGDAGAEAFPVLGAEAGRTLLRMSRDIFPHDRLADRFYLAAVTPYDAAAKDPAVKTLFADGLARLNEAARTRTGMAYADIPAEADRVALLQAIETGPLFQKIRGDMLFSLYNNKEVWPLLGYEGSSWEKGGYINRGFNDIDWL